MTSPQWWVTLESKVHLLKTAEGSRTHCGLLTLGTMMFDQPPAGGELCELCRNSFAVDCAEHSVRIQRQGLN